jgi:hypothetical protein
LDFGFRDWHFLVSVSWYRIIAHAPTDSYPHVDHL